MIKISQFSSRTKANRNRCFRCIVVIFYMFKHINDTKVFQVVYLHMSQIVPIRALIVNVICLKYGNEIWRHLYRNLQQCRLPVAS